MSTTRSRRAASGIAVAVATVSATFALVAPAASAAVEHHTPAAPSAQPNGLIPSHPITAATSLRLPSKAVGARSHSMAAQQLDIDQQVQQNDQWCWAAGGATVEQFQGASTTQAEFCAAGKGTQVGWCPNEPAQIGEVVAGLNNTGFNGRSAGGPVSYATWQQEINAGRPTLTGIYWTAGGGHMETGYGYDASNSSVLVGDPWPSYQRYQTFSYNDYVQNGTFTWGDTVTGISAG